jgi:hypothetical protein
MFNDLDVVVLDQLRQKFEGKCERGALIVKILEIVKRSKCHLSTSQLDGSGDISVQFKVRAIVYQEGELLVGEIQHIERSHKILCKHENAVIDVKGDASVQKLTKGQQILILVTNAKYIKGNEKINIYGIPYSYSFQFDIFHIKNFDITDEDKSLIKDKIRQMDDEIGIYNKLPKNDTKFFNDVLYPFVKSSPKDPQYFSKINMVTLAKKIIDGKPPKDGSLLIMHPRINKQNPEVYLVDPTFLKNMQKNHLLDPHLFKFRIVGESSKVVLKFMSEYLRHLAAIKEMVETYNTSEIRKKHNNLWAIYDKKKK